MNSGAFDEYGDIDAVGDSPRKYHDDLYDANTVTLNIVSRYQLNWLDENQLPLNANRACIFATSILLRTTHMSPVMLSIVIFVNR